MELNFLICSVFLVFKALASDDRDLGLLSAEVFLAPENDRNLNLVTKDGNTEIVISGEMLRQNNTFHNVVLVCHGFLPVRWEYVGDGAPTRLYSSEIRTVESFQDVSSYEYFSTVVLLPERNNEHFTGTYNCHRADRPQVRVFYHLYFPGQFGFPTIRNRVVRIGDNDSDVVIPCGTTSPKMPVALYKIFPKTESSNWTKVTGVTFDPKSGYSLDLSQVSSPFGTYYCSMNDELSFWKVDVVPSKDKEVKVEPDRQIVKQLTFSNVTFRCAANEAVTLTFPNSQVIGTVTNGYNDSEPQFQYYSVLLVDPEYPVSFLGTLVKIQCVTELHRRILHSWEYTSVGEEFLSFKYVASSSKIMCCSASGLSPVYEYVKCETQTDCAIKRKCFQNGRCEYPFPPEYVSAPKGCVAVQFTDRVPTHVAKCSVGDTARIVGISENIHRNDIVLDDLREIDTGDILKLGVMKSDRSEVKFKCSGSLYYFALTFVFGIEHRDGTMDYADPETIDMLESHEPTLRIVDMDSTVRRIVCFAPLPFSSGWRNVSMPVSVTEPTKTKTSLSSSTSSSRDDFARRRSRPARG